MRVLLATLLLAVPSVAAAQPLPGTKPLETKDDLARVMVDGIHRYLDKATAVAAKARDKRWQTDYSSVEKFTKSTEPQRQRLRKVLGVVDRRVPVAMEQVGTKERPALCSEFGVFKAYTVRWTVLPGIHGEGLLLEPMGEVKGCAVAIPDAEQTPEQIAGLAPGVPVEQQFARKLAEKGLRVVVPVLINRDDTYSGSAALGRFTNQTHREFVYRMSFEMGRHVIGYEIQKVLAAVDWFKKEKADVPVAVYGYGEGGLLALYSAAIDPRIDSTVVSGYFGPREKLWEEPIYRNVWGILRDFGDAEIARLVAPRSLIIEPADFKASPAPAIRKGRAGAAPGFAQAPKFVDVLTEYKRIFAAAPNNPLFGKFALSVPEEEKEGASMAPGRDQTVQQLFGSIKAKPMAWKELAAPRPLRLVEPEERQKRQFDEAVGFTQNLLGPSPRKRQENVWSKFDTSSVAKFEKSQEAVRDQFWNDVIGKLPAPTMPMNPRTRLILETPKWKGYEVVLDLYEDVICFGILLVPSDIKAGEKRPVVVCQHGLEGRPMDVVNPKVKTNYYNSFGAQLADRGFVVFAPQNPYIFQNHFRQFTRKAEPLGLHIYSFIVRQHERILDFLSTLPFVDPGRIAFYGLSYGGKVAMRIPALLTRYCLSICSGDFNEWVWKNINLDWVGSYMFTTEYDMYEFDVGHSFNYAEMAALIAPRPFMVERGHSDGVGLDEYVAFEYARVRRLYATLGIADRTEIEFFVGGHVIQGQGTFAFLHRHLKWPAPK